MVRVRASAGLLAWVAALGAGIRLFHALADATLLGPPWQLDALGPWLATTEPAVATMALLRLVVLGVGWYLLGATALGVLARCAGAVRLVALADALTVPALRRLLQSALGLGLATAMVATATPARAQPLPLQLLESAERADDVPDAPSEIMPPDVAPPDVAPPAASSSVPAVGPSPSDAAAATTPSAPGDEHTVVAGESFWRIAEQRLQRAHGRAPADAEIVVYWRQLIDDNRDRLADPGNPDLLFPGQRLVVAPVE